jgi:hypothetical protein
MHGTKLALGNEVFIERDMGANKCSPTQKKMPARAVSAGIEEVVGSFKSNSDRRP